MMAYVSMYHVCVNCPMYAIYFYVNIELHRCSTNIFLDIVYIMNNKYKTNCMLHFTKYNIVFTWN